MPPVGCPSDVGGSAHGALLPPSGHQRPGLGGLPGPVPLSLLPFSFQPGMVILARITAVLGV